jgi:glycosyltransferase involved in cell wall biosynthesis
VKILLLNLYYPPDTSATAKMARTVAEALSAEHEVTVLCGRPSYEPSERRGWRLWRTERMAGQPRVKIIRVGSTDYPRLRMKRRVVNYLSYVFLAVPLALLLRCDAVLAMTDPPFEGIVGAFVALLKRKPFVYNIRDLYPDMAVGGALIAPGRLARIWERMHRWALRRAARVIVLGEDMRERIVAKGTDAARVEIVRDGAEISLGGAPAAELDAEVVRAIRGEFRFVLVHAGNLGFYGAWETLLEAARQCAGPDSSGADAGIGLVFVGEGAQYEAVRAMAEGIANVRFLPFFAAAKIASVMAAADAHVVTVKRGLEGVVAPSKLYGILAAGKPLLVVAPAESDAARIVLRHGCGLTADPERPGKAAAAAREMAGEPEKVKSMGAAAAAAAPGYDRLKELRRFAEILREAAASRKE